MGNPLILSANCRLFKFCLSSFHKSFIGITLCRSTSCIGNSLTFTFICLCLRHSLCFYLVKLLEYFNIFWLLKYHSVRFWFWVYFNQLRYINLLHLLNGFRSFSGHTLPGRRKRRLSRRWPWRPKLISPVAHFLQLTSNNTDPCTSI